MQKSHLWQKFAPTYLGHFSTNLAQIFTSLLTFDADCHLHHDFFWSSFLGECHLRHDFFGMPFLPLTPRFFFVMFISGVCIICATYEHTPLISSSFFGGVPFVPLTPQFFLVMFFWCATCAIYATFLLSFFDLLANIGIWWNFQPPRHQNNKVTFLPPNIAAWVGWVVRGK